MSVNANKDRIFKNSILLYVRMLFSIFLNLLTTRLVLKNLGAEDYGIIGVVGSIIVLLATANSGLTTAIQRYITFELGKADGKTNNVFNTSLTLTLIVSGIFFLVFESLGIVFFYKGINIPEEKIGIAFWVYQLSILSYIVSTISTPYNATVIAHERMGFYAVVNVLQAVMSCLIAYLISLANQRLLVYAILSAAVTIIIRIIYQIYCTRNFPESRYKSGKKLDWTIGKEMGKTTLIMSANGGLQAIYGQGIILIINWTFGVTINAIYNISLQLKNMVLSFAFNVFNAMAPQITKTYASGEYDKHRLLILSGGKLQGYLILLLMVPFYFRAHQILHYWLNNVPDHLVEYCQLSLIFALIYSFCSPISASVYATNQIKKFSTIPDAIGVVALPLVFVAGYYFPNPVILMITVVVVDVLINIVRIYYAGIVCPFSVKDVMKDCVLPILIVGFIDFVVCQYINQLFCNSLWGLIYVCSINMISLLVLVYFLGTNMRERQMLKGFMRAIYLRLEKKH